MQLFSPLCIISYNAVNHALRRGGIVTEGWTEITASWKNEMTFVGLNSAGGAVQMGTLDGKPGVGPMSLLLVAVAGCTGMDIVSILQKKRLNLTDMQVRVRGKRAAEYPMVWTDIHLTYLIWGEGIQPSEVELAIRLSEEKYCSVGIMLGKTARMTSEYLILKPGENAE
jgi:putative redox protein